MLILASASPRRQEILRNAGIPFVVQAADVDETPISGESATECARRLAQKKAAAIFSQRPGQRPSELVLGADTVVVIENQILGKPIDAADAMRMLRLLAGREHLVITGVCLMGSGGSRSDFVDIRCETTRVWMGPLTEEDIRGYVATGEPMDKAGAYAIQGMASRWIPRIEGDYFNVVGLPVALVYEMLRVHGVV